MDSWTKLRKFLGHVVFNESLNGPKTALNIMNEGQNGKYLQEIRRALAIRAEQEELIVHTGPFHRVYGSAIGVRLMGVKKGSL
jgi:hypothetical protein